MSRLTVYRDTDPETPLVRTEDGAAIAAELKKIGVRFERWDLPRPAANASNEEVMATYKPYLDRLMAAQGYGTADVIRITPETPNLPAIRAKFLAEHIHTEDEVRFFVAGEGHFFMHVDGKVYDALCSEGDLISVPANTKHWFDAGERPNVVALRVFTDTTGWTPHYTGDKISDSFPAA
ncbi:MAG: cupin domain-containing protein [Alphaproteobacteria bacterium]|nr:cupin domain-containing protein [Alphaproteobacteria bacterium]